MRIKPRRAPFNNLSSTHKLTAAIAILIVASIGSYMLTISHASAPYASVTASSGSLSGDAKVTTCGSNSGSCVQFGSTPATSLAVHVKAGQLVNGQDQPIRLLGVSADGTEYDCINNNGFSPGSLDSTEATAMKTWHINAVRITLNEDCWLDINGAPTAYSGVNYQNAIKNWITALNNAGIIAILDLQWSAPGTYQAKENWNMADEDHSVTFWSQVASAYVSNPAVIFDLFNEPNLGGSIPTTTDWSCWMNGCNSTFQTTINGSSASVNYTTAGMQQLVTAVRAAGATQPLMLGGLKTSSDPCTQWSNNVIGGTCTQLAPMPTDPLNQLVISFHNYDFYNTCITATCWSSIAQLANAANLPIVTGEFGEDDCTDNYINTYMNWADQNNVSYLAWVWNINTATTCNPGLTDPGSSLNLLENWSGTPSSVSPEAADFMAHLLNELP